MTPKGNSGAVLDAIDNFCRKTWMMNVGDEKGQVLKKAIQEGKPRKVL